jgi:hypothetical protein
MARSAQDPARIRAAERARRRDVALRRTRGLVASVAAAAVGLSGLASVVAAQAFKGHGRRAPAPAPVRRARVKHVHVPAPDRIPAIAGDPAPLQPPAQPPAPAPATPPPSAPAPQVSGGS